MTVCKDKYRGKKEYFLVHSELVTAARFRGTITYMDVARLMGINKPGGYMAGETGQILGEIAEDEVTNGRPMLSAVAVSSTSGKPSEGFFALAKELGLLQDDSPAGHDQFWIQTRDKVYETWKRSAS